jgi:hypothetical protein
MMFWISIGCGSRWVMTNPAHIPSFHYILHPCLTPLRDDIHLDGRPKSTPDGSRGSRRNGIPGHDHCQSQGASRASVPGATGPTTLRSPEGAAEAYRTILSTAILASQLSTGCLAEQPTSGSSSSFHLVVL